MEFLVGDAHGHSLWHLLVKLGDIVYTKYEKARIIGSRALQISLGAPILVKMDEEVLKKINYVPLEIAKLEFEKGVVPIDAKLNN